ncbi:hypothetical protein NDR86_36345 [Nocardia sp. CDC141]|uniref:DUF6968 domain-containing protein n=1 Tax=Nocardia pulmonis TaxID=2951408 RepID=A0A9X2EDL6_9NOCA|nr:hypothetical protein [Nocardia pulmonis]
MSGAIGGVIMSRLVSKNGRAVIIEVGKPTPKSGGGAECAFRIDGHPALTAHGSDELAALYRALVRIGTLLAQANENTERIRFAAEPGFPNQTADRATFEADMSDVLAARAISHNGERHLVMIGRPFQPLDQQLALCPFQVDDRPLAVAGGWDGMQALLTAVGMIGAWLQLPRNWPLSTAP